MEDGSPRWAKGCHVAHPGVTLVSLLLPLLLLSAEVEVWVYFPALSIAFFKLTGPHSTHPDLPLNRSLHVKTMPPPSALPPVCP